MISHKYKCIFVHIPKTGGTSIEAALGHYDKSLGRGQQDHRTLAQIEPWALRNSLTPQSLRGYYKRLSNLPLRVVSSRDTIPNQAVKHPLKRLKVTRKQYNSYFRFTIIRDPWSRAVSWYKNILRDELSQKGYSYGLTNFPEFMRNHAGKGALRPQTHWLLNRNRKLDINFIGRFENINVDFKVACTEMGIQNLELPWILKSKNEQNAGIEEFFDERTDALVKTIYAHEIELFDLKSPL